ncbi:hypothetical protein E9531_15555 [Lampropedia puyangensis]|uniref:Uncharacterized protein n=1 Tax=Lampropedia puyangensis TaxID=1330072 RepID=A0A4S8ESH2_9BURK|nr:hypothetical protein [Lampropedia puyangensis]THT97712.1 hypothetical protein E9531_15555 [Lampropedia puyangensis]
MPTDQTAQEDLVVCPNCKIKISPKRLQKHINKVHSPEAIAAHGKRLHDEKLKQIADKNLAKKRTILKNNINALEQAKRKYLEVKVQCSYCEKMMPLHSLKSHFMDVHRIEMTKDMQVLYALSGGEYMFQTPAIREAYALRASGVMPDAANKPTPKKTAVTQTQNKFSSARQRENFWREQQGIERSRSEDLFDRTKVLSGGAYGLGKNNKH